MVNRNIYIYNSHSIDMGGSGGDYGVLLNQYEPVILFIIIAS